MRLKAFTLIELLITIAVIAILSTLVVMTTKGMRQRAVQSKVSSHMVEGAKGLEVFKSNNDGQIPMVQQPWVPGDHSRTKGETFGTNRRVYNAQVLVPFYYTGGGISFAPGENGFSSRLFNGSNLGQFIGTRLADTAGKDVYYVYITRDCSFAALPPDGHHLLSAYPDYLLMAENPTVTGTNPDNVKYTYVHNGTLTKTNNGEDVPDMTWPGNTWTYAGVYTWNDCPPLLN